MNTQPQLFDPGKPVQETRAVLVEHVHLSFAEWFAQLVRECELDEHTMFTIMQLRVEYLHQCWMDEVKWKEWHDAAEATKSVSGKP